MLKNIKTFFPILLVIFVAIELFLVSRNQNQVAIFLYLGLMFYLKTKGDKYLITFFVYHLPLAPIVKTDFKILNFVGPHEIIYGFALFVLYKLYQKHRGNIKLNKPQKVSIAFVYFLFFYAMYPLVKDVNLGLLDGPNKNMMYLIKNFVRYFLYYQSLAYLIKVIYLTDLKDYIITGIRYSIITITVSMIYTKELISMGTGVNVSVQRLKIIMAGKYERFVGFYYAGGDENSVGIFMVAAFAFFLALYEKDQKIKEHFVFMMFAILGALMTGSRTTFMALTTVILIFMITNKSAKSKFVILLAIVIFYFSFHKQLDMVVQRFFDPDAQAAVDPEKGGRVAKWIIYVEWLMANLDTLLIGKLRNINYHNAPHNYFILIVYTTGIVPLVIFVKLLFKLFKLTTFKLTKFTLKNAYYIIPFPFILMTVNSFGSAIYLWIYLPIGAYFLMPEKVKKKNIS